MLSFLFASRVFMGSGLSVIAWGGDKGAFHLSESDRPVKRSDYASSSIVVRGSFQMTEAPGDPNLWSVVLPGQLCNEVMPDFEVGMYKWMALEDGSLEFCCGTVTPAGGADFGRFSYKGVGSGVVQMPKKSLLVVATGEAEVKGLKKVGPAVIHAKTQDLEVLLTGKGMWLSRQ